jgi:hypothetical protein
MVNLEAVTIELSPTDVALARPTLVTRVTAAKLNLGVLRLPPAATPQSLKVPVTVQGSGKKIPGATLRFYAALTGASGGEASFRREFQTDKDGVAMVTVLPGNAGETRNYAVAIIPPPNSPYAARCIPTYAVAAAPSAQIRVGASIDLGPKAEVTGLVLDAGGRPQSGVMLTALRKGSTYVTECATDVASPQPVASTDMDGSYRLRLDPGIYRFEYEPAMASTTPLFVEEDVPVDHDAERTVHLPAGVLGEGFVGTPDGGPAAGCEVRVFAPGREGAAPALLAHTRTAASGRFRIVLPRQP